VTLSNALDTLLSRLPGHFKKDKDSNNYKLLSLVAKQSGDNQALADTIQRFWDVDQAEGIGLNRLGKDEGLSRGSYDNETYRKLIKIQYIVNLSEGDRESINAILRAYMGEEFFFVEEGWNSFLEEPASMIITTGPTVGNFPFELLERIKATAIRIYFSAQAIADQLKIRYRDYRFDVPYRICNTFITDEVKGGLSRSTVNLVEKAYNFDVLYPICNTFVTSTITVENVQQNVMLTEEYRNNDILYKRAGDAVTGEGAI
jgi:hypothetical protein